MIDEIAVESFARAMRAKLAVKRSEGRGGWYDPEACPPGRLAQLLAEHIAKGDPVDVGNFAMMLHCRGESTVAPQLSQPAPSSGGAGDDAAIPDDLAAAISAYHDGPLSDEHIQTMMYHLRADAVAMADLRARLAEAEHASHAVTGCAHCAEHKADTEAMRAERDKALADLAAANERASLAQRQVEDVISRCGTDVAEARSETGMLAEHLRLHWRAWVGLEKMPYECGPGGERALRSLGKRMADKAEAVLAKRSDGEALPNPIAVQCIALADALRHLMNAQQLATLADLRAKAGAA